MKILWISFVTALLTTLDLHAETRSLNLSPVPYNIRLPDNIAKHLVVEPIEGLWEQDVRNAGGDTGVTVYYQSEAGQKPVLMSIFYFPEANFDIAQHPDEPPPFGRVVIRMGGKILSVAGPQDTIFDLDTQDGRNVVQSNDWIYDSRNYEKHK